MIARLPHHRTAPRFARAFTLIELLTVIAIIGILAAILIPTVGAVRAKAASAKSASNLRQMGAALGMFLNDQKSPKVTEPGTFDQQLAPYLGISKDSAGNYSKSAEGVFMHPRQKPRDDDRPARSYAQQTVDASLSALAYSKIRTPSRVMIYGERASTDGNPGGYVGQAATFTGFKLGNHVPGGIGPDPYWGDINGSPGVFNYCFVDGHVETNRSVSERMLGRGYSNRVALGVWTVADGD